LDANIPIEQTKNFTEKEGEYLIEYDRILGDYMESIGLDLTLVWFIES
jgi:hypothetical protein